MIFLLIFCFKPAFAETLASILDSIAVASGYDSIQDSNIYTKHIALGNNGSVEIISNEILIKHPQQFSVILDGGPPQKKMRRFKFSVKKIKKVGVVYSDKKKEFEVVHWVFGDKKAFFLKTPRGLPPVNH